MRKAENELGVSIFAMRCSKTQAMSYCCPELSMFYDVVGDMMSDLSNHQDGTRMEMIGEKLVAGCL